MKSNEAFPDETLKLLEELHYFCVIMYGDNSEYPYTDNLSLLRRVKNAIASNGEKDGKKISKRTKN